MPEYEITLQRVRTETASVTIRAATEEAAQNKADTLLGKAQAGDTDFCWEEQESDITVEDVSAI